MSGPDDISELMDALDEHEPAPPEFVERLWDDLESTLRGQPTTPVPIVDVSTTQRPDGTRGVRWNVLVAAASVVLVAGAVLVLLLRDGTAPLPPAERSTIPTAPATTAPIPTEPTVDSTVPPTGRATPASVEAACADFRTEVPSLEDVRAHIATGDDAAPDDLSTLDEALGLLIDDFESLGGPPAEVTVDLRIARGAFEDAADQLADGDTEQALASFDVALDRLVSLTAGAEPPVDGCLPLDAAN